ncbi:MAG TPA: amidohydrolase family protein [Acidimicrobiales bacterium]|nr:amidohydrolase family protein [Acidimicrobiales bacterium]
MQPLPLPPGPITNGEFVPRPPSALDMHIHAEMCDTVDRAARRAGLDRRTFLRSAAGVAAALTTYNLAACSSKGAPSAATSTSTTSALPSGGSFSSPAPDDVAACDAALQSRGEFIFDVHTHHVMPDRPWVRNAPDTVGLVEGMLPPDCMAGDPLECVNRAAYLHDIFLASDTTVAMLSDVPNSGPDDAPVPFDDAVGTQQLAADLTHGGAPRVLVHNVIAPNVGDIRARLDDMSANVATGKVAAFKVYTAWGPDGRGFSLEHPTIGLPVIQHAHDLGVKVFVAHKGLPLVNFDRPHNRPDDMVAVSKLFPDMQFVIFHAAWDADRREGAYAPGATIGIDTLIDALDRHGVAPNSNVWVDLGTVWRQLLTRPDQAAHALGKVLTRVGENRVLWGTDAVWYGSPQAQIMAFRAFEISAEFQDRFGYPAMTDTLRRKIFGLNAASLFGLDVEATRCALVSDPLAEAKPNAAAAQHEGALPSPWTPRGPTTRRELLQTLARATGPWAPD